MGFDIEKDGMHLQDSQDITATRVARDRTWITDKEDFLQKMRAGWKLYSHKEKKGMWIEAMPGIPGIKVEWHIVLELMRDGHLIVKDHPTKTWLYAYDFSEQKKQEEPPAIKDIYVHRVRKPRVVQVDKEAKTLVCLDEEELEIARSAVSSHRRTSNTSKVQKTCSYCGHKFFTLPWGRKPKKPYCQARQCIIKYRDENYPTDTDGPKATS